MSEIMVMLNVSAAFLETMFI